MYFLLCKDTWGRSFVHASMGTLPPIVSMSIGSENEMPAEIPAQALITLLVISMVEERNRNVNNILHP